MCAYEAREYVCARALVMRVWEYLCVCVCDVKCICVFIFSVYFREGCGCVCVWVLCLSFIGDLWGTKGSNIKHGFCVCCLERESDNIGALGSIKKEEN